MVESAKEAVDREKVKWDNLQYDRFLTQMGAIYGFLCWNMFIGENKSSWISTTKNFE